MSKKLDEPWARYDRLFFKSPQYKAMPQRWRGLAYLYLLGLSGYSRHVESDGRLSIPEATMVAMEMGYSMRPMLDALEGVGLVEYDGDDVILPKYSKWNETSEELAEIRAKRAAAGKAGGVAKALASGLASASPVAKQMVWQKPSREEKRREESSEPNGSSPPLPPTTLALVPGEARDVPTAFVRQQVFERWREATGRGFRVVLDDERRKAIDKGIATFGLPAVLRALEGVRHDAWSRGANDRNRRYDEPKHIFGTAERIEHFCGLADQAERGTLVLVGAERRESAADAKVRRLVAEGAEL